MLQYKSFTPTVYDHHITLSDREEWFVLPCFRKRDSTCLEASNFAAALKLLAERPMNSKDPVENNPDQGFEMHQFEHWAIGWYEIILVRPKSLALSIADEIEKKLADHPVLDEDDLYEREMKAANEKWKSASTGERLAYIREHRSQFEFHTFADMLSCVRGNYFAGDASELLA